jgi:hypothetical protein
MAGSLSEHYAAILSDLRSRYEQAKLALRELESDIARVEHLAGQFSQPSSLRGAYEMYRAGGTMTLSGDAAADPVVNRPLPRPDFSKISVRWAVLWLLSEYESGPLRTSEIATLLTAGGYQSNSDSFLNAVSAVLSGMKGKGELESTADGYVATDKGRRTWQLIRQSAKFRDFTSSNEHSLLSAQ